VSLARHCRARNPIAVGIRSGGVEHGAALDKSRRRGEILDLIPSRSIAPTADRGGAGRVDLDIVTGPKRGRAGDVIPKDLGLEKSVVQIVQGPGTRCPLIRNSGSRLRSQWVVRRGHGYDKVPGNRWYSAWRQHSADIQLAEIRVICADKVAFRESSIVVTNALWCIRPGPGSDG
jgi:hypothetical protein